MKQKDLLKLTSCIIGFICNSLLLIPSFTNAQNGKSHYPTAMVVSEQRLASEVGANILKNGGNAIDAAVAVGYALAVVNPCCGNLGGGGFMTIHFANGKNTFINFRERAPLVLREQLFLNDKGTLDPEKSIKGYLAVGVPGTVMGFEKILKKYGTLSRQQVIAPAIQLAEKGFILQQGDINFLKQQTSTFAKEPNVAAIFLKNNKPYQVGDRLIQTDLAQTLKLISAKGAAPFYQGEIARKIVRASERNGGVLILKDFTNYYVEEFEPLECTYRGYTIISAPPPSSGGVTLCVILNILEAYPLKSFGHYHPESIYYLVKAMGLAFHDRNTQLGDPDFVDNPVSHLLSKNYAKQLRAEIPSYEKNNDQQTNLHSDMHEGINTTHYSVIDKQGNAVSVTYILNSFFGAKVIADHTGFFLNNEMDDFAIGKTNQFGLSQGKKNKIEPGKRPLSSMTPTIVLQKEKSNPQQTVFMILGSPGGPRIITSTLLTILNVIDYGMDLQAAIDTGRIHFQGTHNVIDVEKNTLSPDIIHRLSEHHLNTRAIEPWGAVEAIYINPLSHELVGANDKRRPAGAAIPVY